MIKINL